MARQIIDIGIQGNDGTGDSIRESFRKVNDNFSQLFGVFGGETIAFTDLDDAPSSYGANQIIISDSDGTGLTAKTLAGGAGIQINTTDPNQVTINMTGGKLIADNSPMLAGSINGQSTFTIGNIADPSPEIATAFNTLHGTSITEDNLVISKQYADQNYVRSGGGKSSGSLIRIRQEPENTSAYTHQISSWSSIDDPLGSGYAVFNTGHSLTSGNNGYEFVYTNTGNTPASGLTPGVKYYARYVSDTRLYILIV